MADKHLIIEIGGREVDSHLRHDPSASPHDLIRITSTCEGHQHSANIVVQHRAGYTAEQAEYDIEQARWKSAEAAAGKAHIKALLPSLLQDSVQQQPRRLSTQQHQKPTSTADKLEYSKKAL